MLRSFFKLLSVKQASFTSMFFLDNLVCCYLNSEENEKLNLKLKIKLNERFYHDRDISYELTEEFT